MAASTALFLVSTNCYVFLVARILQGIAGAVLGVIGLTLMFETVDKTRTGEAMGYVSTAMTTATICGPMLGGVIYQVANYYAVFAVPIALLCIDIVLRLLMIEKRGAEQWRTEETGPSTMASQDRHNASGANEPHALHPEMEENAGTNPPSSSKRENATNRTPLLSSSRSDTQNQRPSKIAATLHLLAEPRLLVALFTIFASFTVITALESTLPIFVINRFHWNTSGAGLIFLAINIPSLFGPALGKLVDHYGARVPCTIGCVLMATSITLLHLVENPTKGQVILLVGLLVLLGFSVASVNLTAMTEVGNSIHAMEERDPRRFGEGGGLAQGYAFLNMAYAAAQLIGPLLAGFVAHRIGWKGMTLVLGACYFVTAIPIALFSGGWILSNRKSQRDIHQEEAS
ncbi:MAG: hypothetical protein Q9217_005581 [Psora testacea]